MGSLLTEGRGSSDKVLLTRLGGGPSGPRTVGLTRHWLEPSRLNK